MFPGKDKPLEDKEFPDEADLAEDEQEMVLLSRCPACGELIYEDAQQCPHCKEWIVPPGQLWRQSRRWYVRAGLYLAKTILINWIVWLILGAIAVMATIWGLAR
ncbi:MAG: hypothetical protein AMJ81_07390 [Phycisphaerae bacterium SM23_33]|nr:MAG: hypothetical protein AMJ81_07390 [Phycisphaerae bacterium SM23_33]